MLASGRWHRAGRDAVGGSRGAIDEVKVPQATAAPGASRAEPAS
jgi:hypothetical protein